MSISNDLDWEKMDGLIPAIVQDAESGEVRMLGYMDREALEITEQNGLVTFFSRSRQKLWRKGETTGNVLEVQSISPDCDGDAVLILARPRGPTCHTGARSCFRTDPAALFTVVADLAQTITDRASADPRTSYTARLLSEGIKRVAQKVGEEGVEVALAAMEGDRNEVASEAADLLYHLAVLLEASGSSWSAVLAELRERQTASSATASS